MRILLTGASGLIGRHLTPLLREAGHDVVRLVRQRPPQPQTDAVYFDPAGANPAPLEGFDAVIHLAGENIAKRWNKRRKRSILASRGEFTARLCTALAGAPNPPAHFLGASGIGYYGYDHPEPLTEDSPAGEGFLVQVSEQWEAGTHNLLPSSPTDPRPRIAIMRIAAVLSPEGGALAKLMTPFRFGLGAVMGDGRQIMSWISLPDVLAAILHVLHAPGLSGAINLTSPNPVTNREFSRALAKALHRPLLMRLPKSLVKLMFGQMAVETILASQNAIPAKLLASGFTFRHPRFEDALYDLLG